MDHQQAFFRSILNSLTEHIAVIDSRGTIQFVNHPWIEFGVANQCAITEAWQGVNYLEVCDDAASRGEPFGEEAAALVRQIIANGSGTGYLEYPCHSPDEERWFMMRVTALQWEGEPYFIVSHQNITERKQAEQKVALLSLTDGLTGVANRRRFDAFLDAEWRRAMRLSQPISLILLDIDHFKLYNDTYGHLAGDDCLRRIGAFLDGFARRPGDLAARYGGEEFAFVLGNTGAAATTRLAVDILAGIRAMQIEHLRSPTAPYVTASIGLACISPRIHEPPSTLIRDADRALYQAKHSGRDRLAVARAPARTPVA